MKISVLDRNRTYYERAKANTRKNLDGSVPEVEIIRELKLIIDFDEDAERERKAKDIINSLCKSNPSEDTGQELLHFADEGTWEWEPLRLIRSDDGDLIENSKATLRFKMADAQRSEKHAAETQASARRKRHEADIFTTWTIAQIEAGKPESERTWGKCVDALGIHDPLGETDEDDAEE